MTFSGECAGPYCKKHKVFSDYYDAQVYAMNKEDQGYNVTISGVEL